MYEQLVQQKKNLAHAYVLEGDHASTVSDLERFLDQDLAIKLQANPNIFRKDFDRLGVDDVRALGESQSKTAMGQGNKIFIVSFFAATVEAQNAMLKILEEPTPGTMWFLLVPDSRLLLSTIISRVQLLAGESHQQYQELVDKFFDSSYTEREKICAQFVGDSKKNITPDRAGAGQFVVELASQVLRSKPDGFTEIYRDLEQMADYITDRSSSVKYIMEYISIRIPVSP